MMKPDFWIVSFSGGKDSTAMLLRLLEEKWPVDMILFVDTGLEFPAMYDHIDKVEQYIGRPITRIKAEHDFEYYFCHAPIKSSAASPTYWCSVYFFLSSLRYFSRGASFRRLVHHRIFGPIQPKPL